MKANRELWYGEVYIVMGVEDEDEDDVKMVRCIGKRGENRAYLLPSRLLLDPYQEINIFYFLKDIRVSCSAFFLSAVFPNLG